MSEPRKHPPRCRYCGAHIRKATTVLWFKPERSKHDEQEITLSGWAYSYGALPKTRAEAQKRTNGTIMSVRRQVEYTYGKDNISTPHDVGIDRVTLWDGASYVDEYFCNGDHAKKFAYVMARAGHRTEAHRQATERDQANDRQSQPAPR